LTAISGLPSPESATHTRLRRWVLILCGAWMVFSLAPYLPPLAPHRWPVHPKLIVFSLVALAQTALLFAAARRRELGRRLRQAIALLAAAMFLVAVSDTLTALLDVTREGPALQSVNDVLELAYNLLGLGGLLWLPLAPLRRDGRWLVALDIAVAVGGMVAVLFLTTTLPNVSAAAPGERSRILQYGLIAAGNLVALNLILVRGLARPVARAVSFLAATVVIEIVYWVIVQMALAKLITDRRPIDALFGIDQVCYALAGLAFLTARVESGRHPLMPEWMRELNPLPAIAIIAVGVMLSAHVLSGVTSGLAPGVIALVVLSLIMVTRVMLAAHDRSRLVRLELETEQRLLAGRVRAVKRLAGGIAHEFNNQMAVIIGTAELEMAGTPGANAPQEGLDEIRKAGQRVADLTAHLLAYAGDSSSAREAVPAQELMEAMAASVTAVAGKGVTVHFDCAPAMSAVRVERTLIEECVRQLVRNACEASPEGGDVFVRVDQRHVARGELSDAILPAPAGTYVVIEVRDTGSGIAAADLQRIFDPFFSSRSPADATGLGLAVVHGAISSHAGGIVVESEPGAGTAVRLYLPVETVSPAD